MRLKIAVELDLPNRSDIQPVERDDGGPFLKKYHPNISVTLDFGDEGSTATIFTDDLGFCNPPDRPYGREKIDIMVIGDSLTWCTAVTPDEAWPALLADLTGKSTYNLGFPGVGLYEYLVFLRKYGLQKSPEVVVLNFTEGNDFRDALRYWRFKTHGISEEGLTEKVGFLGRILGPVSLVYNMLVGAWFELFEPKQTSSLAGDSLLDRRLASIDKRTLNFRYALDFESIPVRAKR